MSTTPKPVAVVLVSGGLDSTTCLAIAAAAGHDVVAVTFDYGQRHAVELEAARRVAAHYGVSRHLVFQPGLFREIGGSALTDDIAVPQEGVDPDAIPVTYVPARNLVFLSYAVGVAETAGADAIYIGVNALDYSGYPDCRPEFVASFQQTANLATKRAVQGRPVEIRTPLLALGKAEIVARAQALGAPLHLTHSCYAPTMVPGAAQPAACGTCDSCRLRLRGFAEAGLTDPIRYADR